MKFKALRTKKEPKEFIAIEYINGQNIVFTHELPNPLSMTATMDSLKEYFEKYSPLPKDINLDDFELGVYEITEIL